MDISGSISCLNFEVDTENVDFKKLMNEMVYSPSAKYAATILSSNDNSFRFFLLDVLKMTFHEYRNNVTGTLIQDLKMDMFYWYGDDCLVFIYVDTPNRKIHQTPIIMNHKQKTCEPKETVFYDSAQNFRIDAPSPREAKTIQYKGEKYVLIISRSITLYSMNIHAVPYHPYASLPILKFILSRDVMAISNIIDFTAYYNGRVGIKFSPQISVVSNIVYFPIEYYFWDDMNNITHKKDLLGIHFALELAKLPEASEVVLNEHDHIAIAMDYMNANGAAFEYKEYTELDPEIDRQLARTTLLRNSGAYRFHKGNFFLVSQSVEFGLQITTVDYTECSKRRITTIHKESNALESEVAISLIPCNILIAKKMSPNIISCSTIPYPFNDTVLPTLEEMALAKTYMKYRDVNVL